MRKTLEVLNDLEAKGFIIRYAIGGAVATLWYMEPTDTIDLDIFVIIKADKFDLNPLANVNEELLRRGYTKRDMYDMIEGTPVQFLPAYPELVQEAVNEALEKDYDGIPTRVPSPEHLLAVMVQAGRPKDRARVVQMREQAKLDDDKLLRILSQHSLLEKYKQWTQ